MALIKGLFSTHFQEPRPSEPSKLEEHYQLIAETLLTAEASCLKIGDILLLPVAVNRERSKKFEGPLEEFLRLQLLGIPSQSISLFIENLESKQTDSELHIEAAKRSRLPNSLLPAVILMLCALKIVLSSSATGNLLFGILGIIAARYLLLLSKPEARRASFIHTLERELKRRVGEDLGGPGAAPLVPA